MDLNTIVITIIVLAILWGMYRSYIEQEKEEDLAKNRTSKGAQKILDNIKLYSKKPHLRYRDMITTNDLQKEFDKQLKKPKYQKILKNLKPDEISNDLLNLAMKIQSQDPDIQKKVDKILKE
jgi:hypothetical protein